MAWQHMETAPKDGTRILVTRPHQAEGGPNQIEIAAWNDDRHSERPHAYWEWDRSEMYSVAVMRLLAPIAWMPLPESPERDSTRAGGKS